MEERSSDALTVDQGDEPLNRRLWVRIIFRASDLSVPFRMFVVEEAGAGRLLSVAPAHLSSTCSVIWKLSAADHSDRDRRIGWEAAMTGVLSVLKQRAERGGQGLRKAGGPAKYSS